MVEIHGVDLGREPSSTPCNLMAKTPNDMAVQHPKNPLNNGEKGNMVV